MARKPKTPADLSDESLAEVRDFVHGYIGAIQRLADIMSKRSADRISRQMVSRWLAENPEKRVRPSHGYALLIQQSFPELKKAMESETQ